MRTPEQIIARIEAVRTGDFFGAQSSDLINALTYESAKPFLKPEVTPDEWAKAVGDPRSAAIGYMEFAWGKANGNRGLSANRSIDHYRAWMWLLGIDDFDAVADAEYQFYGKPILVIVAEALSIDWRALDDGRWVNDEDGDNEKPGDHEINRLVQIGQGFKADIERIASE